MKLTINGSERLVESVDTVQSLLEQLGYSSRIVVVELNREIVNRNSYPDTDIKDGDSVEILQMMAGG